MPVNQEQYSQNQLDLIFSQTANYHFDEAKGDFVKLSIYYASTGQYYGSFSSNNILPNGMPEIKTYYTWATDESGNDNRNVHIKPNEILNNNNIPSGNYRLVFDFLRDITASRYLQPENFLLYSQTLNNSAWLPAENFATITLSDENTAPDGSTTAWKIEDSDSGINQYIQQTLTSDVIPNDGTKSYISSIYLKKGTAVSTGFKVKYGNDGTNDAHVNVVWAEDGSISELTGGGAANSTFIDVGNDWYKIITTRLYDGTSGDTIFKIFPANYQEAGIQFGTVYVWGAQIQEGTVDEGYIVTTDTAILPGFNDLARDAWITTNPRYILTEISPSRKEIRIVGLNDTVPNAFYFDTSFRPYLNEQIYNANPGATPESYSPYSYDKVLGLTYGRLIPINSFTFDNSHPDSDHDTGINISLILRMNESLPGDIPPLSAQSPVSIYKRLINTQTQDIMYVSSVTHVSIGDGLTVDDTFGADTDESLDNFQNENDLILSASISNAIQEDIEAAQVIHFLVLPLQK